MTNASIDHTFELYELFSSINTIDPSFYNRYDVKRGLRNADGTGVLAGVTNISNVHGYLISDDVKIPDEGSLLYRGYELYDLLGSPGNDRRFAFEEIAYLLLLGHLPTREGLNHFVRIIDSERNLPDGFTVSLVMHDMPPDLMNLLARSILLLYSYDTDAEERTPEHEIYTAASLISRLPRIMVLAYYAKQARFANGSMIMHPFIPGQSTAETILSMLRPDRQFAPEEARMLDIMLCLHAEHGGGNNSTFTTRVLSSAETDPYSTYAAAIGSLKGSRHGGANHKVLAMQAEAKREIADWEDDGQVADFLTRIVKKEAYDRSGLIYGMGHAVYTKSDPRAVICKRFAERLAVGTEFEAELNLLKSIERLSPEILRTVKGTSKDVCANVDMYSGMVYSMLGIPEDLFTPLFACARMAGWAAHRFEEIVSGKRIIRPAYKATFPARQPRPYVPIDER
ncbi:MAG TPA: citrate synthase [Eggerthellaceae bacterium]|nr:citrate synthase [Eggerthellaceae bacterium]